MNLKKVNNFFINKKTSLEVYFADNVILIDDSKIVE
jgi:hypothetical protein